MKKLSTFILVITILAAASVPAFAQGRNCSRAYGSRSSNSRGYYDNSRGYYDNAPVYDNSRSYYDYGNRNGSVWNRHRDKLTVAAGTGAGVVLGAIIGGRRGAAVGALSGAAASALYAYKIRNRGYRY